MLAFFHLSQRRDAMTQLRGAGIPLQASLPLTNRTKTCPQQASVATTIRVTRLPRVQAAQEVPERHNPQVSVSVFVLQAFAYEGNPGGQINQESRLAPIHTRPVWTGRASQLPVSLRPVGSRVTRKVV